MARPIRPDGESASATTSLDNSSSALPYVIVITAFTCIIALNVCLGDALATLAWDVLNSYGLVSSSRSTNKDDLLNLLNQNSSDGIAESQSYALDEENVLSYTLYTLEQSTNDYVAASDYAGSQSAVSEYVRTFTALDGEALAKLRSYLRTAKTLEGDARTEELEQAAAVCKDIIESIGALELPAASDISGEEVQNILDYLGDAQSQTIERWNALYQYVDIARSPNNHTSDELDNLDSNAVENLYNASYYLYSALTVSAAHK